MQAMGENEMQTEPTGWDEYDTWAAGNNNNDDKDYLFELFSRVADVEQCLDMAEVTGSNPVLRTIIFPAQSNSSGPFFCCWMMLIPSEFNKLSCAQKVDLLIYVFLV